MCNTTRIHLTIHSFVSDDAAEPETATSLPVPIATTVPSIPPPTAVFVSPPTHCEDGDQVYENGASWNPNGDVCISCMCEDGLNICIATGCLAACSQEEQVFLPGVCCPLCPGKNTQNMHNLHSASYIETITLVKL